MKRRLFTILSTLSLLLFVSVAGCSSEPADRRPAEPIKLVPRLDAYPTDVYRVWVEFAYADVARYHGPAEIELIAVGDASLPVRPGTRDGIANRTHWVSGYIKVDFERAVPPHDLRTLVFRKPNYSARWRITVSPSGGYDLRATPERCPECGYRLGPK